MDQISNRSPLEQLVSTNKTLRSTTRPTPPQAHRNLEAFVFLNEHLLAKENLREPRIKNLTIAEKAATKQLKSDGSVTIKETTREAW